MDQTIQHGEGPGSHRYDKCLESFFFAWEGYPEEGVQTSCIQRTAARERKGTYFQLLWRAETKPIKMNLGRLHGDKVLRRARRKLLTLPAEQARGIVYSPFLKGLNEFVQPLFIGVPVERSHLLERWFFSSFVRGRGMSRIPPGK